VKKGTDQYNAIANSNIVASMTTVLCGLPKGTDISGVPLAKFAEWYLQSIGLSADEIAALKAKLSTPMPVSGASTKLIIFEFSGWAGAERQLIELAS